MTMLEHNDSGMLNMFTDAHVVAHYITESNYVPSIDHIIQDCKKLMNSLASAKVSFIRWDENVVAHNFWFKW
jgi:hypothetical protein